VGVADADVPAFTSAVKEAAGENAPPHKFVAPRADGVELASFFDDREVEGWRRSVDAVLEMSAGSADRPYRRSVFFRPTGIRREDGEVVVARRTSLEEGESVRLLLAFHNPHLEPGEVEGLELRALLLAGAGRGEEAFRILSALNPELLGDDARFLLFRERILRDQPHPPGRVRGGGADPPAGEPLDRRRAPAGPLPRGGRPLRAAGRGGGRPAPDGGVRLGLVQERPPGGRRGRGSGAPQAEGAGKVV